MQGSPTSLSPAQDNLQSVTYQPNPLDIWVSEEVLHQGSVSDERADEIEMAIAF